jgi:two-component system, NtrC family, sensor kinase
MPRRFPIRARLTIGALAPLFVAMFCCSLAGLYLISAKVASQAQEKVRTDLNSAREVLRSESARLGELVELTAGTTFIATAIVTGDRRDMAALLTSLQRKKRLDILTLVDRTGRVLYREHNPAAVGDDLAGNHLVKRALAGEQVSGTALLSPEELAAERAALAQQATIDLVPTPHARTLQATTERTGMVLAAAGPVRDAGGRVIGALYGAVLLNNNNTLVDRIKEIVYEGVRFGGQEVGTATIFLGDVRIATNVPAAAGGRAIGTRLSEEVYDRVILEKKKWVGRAFVVNGWYLTAYEPILNPQGEAIGALYVGMLEKPYAALKKNVSLALGGVLLISSLIGLAVSGLIGAHLARPIRDLESLARRVALGERNLQIVVQTADELEDLAGEFNEMTRALARQDEEITVLNRHLEQKVVERTTQLEEQTILLLQTQADLARAERLADLGVMAAGVAHEINTPLAIIRGNAEVLEMCVPPDHPNREEIGIISRQTERMARIVGNLLAFARQKKLQQGTVPIHELLDDIVGHLGHQVSLTAIEVTRLYSPELTTIGGDADQLRQVFTNLMLNAVQAMPAGGVLTLGTRLAEDGRSCAVDIADTGQGIAPEHLEKIFSPFFTTKASGSGLGLSVSYGIVKDHGGEISVVSTPERGTLFRVVLPLYHAEHSPAEQED